MKRTPMLPRKPAFPSVGPTILTPVAVSIRGLLFIGQLCRAKVTYDHREAQVRNEAACRARRADAAADHRERGRVAREAWPRPDVGQRSRRTGRRSALDRVPPLPRRTRALRSMLLALAGCESSAGVRRARSRARARTALRLLRADRVNASQPA